MASLLILKKYGRNFFLRCLINTFLDENLISCIIGTKTGHNLYYICMYCDFYCVSWFIWFIFICHYTTCKRNWCTKGIGRKVSTIVTLLSKEFLKLVLFATIIAFPVAWYAMNNWLKDFAYRINIYQLVGVWYCSNRCVHRSIGYSKFPGNKSGACKSCKEFENGMIIERILDMRLKVEYKIRHPKSYIRNQILCLKIILKQHFEIYRDIKAIPSSILQD